MASSDLNVLLDMGFDKERAEYAVKQSGGCTSLSIRDPVTTQADLPTVQGALQWLEDNQDKPVADIKAAAAKSAETDSSIEPPALKDGEAARSLVCNDCGKKFRSQAQAEFHATKTYVSPPSLSTHPLAIDLADSRPAASTKTSPSRPRRSRR